METRKVGRPRIFESDIPLSFRVDGKDAETLREAGKKLGSMSRFIRTVAVPAAVAIVEGRVCEWPKITD